MPTREWPGADLPYLDKVVHLCEYLLFAWILVQAVRASRMPERDYLWWAWIYATSYGVLMELVQLMVPWRSAEWLDVVANTAGAAIGVWVGQHVPKRVPS
ncbi:MAG: VanZ family protein [Candidatus Omnitrophica bacterium]|nr:VanZ family protein [Candidatus Omnitrophota bacterium]